MLKIPTPPLPYSLPANGKITFSSGLTLFICFHKTKDKISFLDNPGINPGVQRIKGRLINPKLLPSEVKEAKKSICEITDISTGFKVKGVLTITEIIQSQWKEATQAYGAVISGEFNQESLPEQGNTEDPFSVS